jgi:hypothetical protein
MHINTHLCEIGQIEAPTKLYIILLLVHVTNCTLDNCHWNFRVV